MDFALSVVRCANRNYSPLVANIRSEHQSPLGGASLWGAFFGLFGLASNQLIVVTTGNVSEINDRWEKSETVVEAKTEFLVPTVRPTDATPRTREGLYVFRFFDVTNTDVDTIADLSNEAWSYFENTESYKAEPQGLFCQKERNTERGFMLLCTWYDGLNSWQTSRQPHPRAAALFQQRAQLTHSAKAIATRLVL